MSKPIVAIKLSKTNYAGLVNLANRVFASMTGNLNFTTPSPTLASLQTATTDVTNAIGVWGPKGNRGSHADLVDLRQKALTLSQILKSEAQYVQNTAQTAAGSDYVAMGAIIQTAGYQLANAKTPQGVLQMVANYHQFVSRKLNNNQIKLKWKRPLNTTSPSNVKSYTVYRGTTAMFSAATVLATTTKTTITDTNATGAVQTYSYWVVPVNTAGDGVMSDVITLTIPSA